MPDPVAPTEVPPSGVSVDGAPVAPLAAPVAPAAIPAAATEVPQQFRNADGTTNVEALLKSNNDNQAGFTRVSQELAATKATPVSPAAIPAPSVGADLSADDASIDDYCKAAGFTQAELHQSYMDNDGSLTNEQYAAFKTTANLGKGMVDDVITQRIAQSVDYIKSQTAECVALAGGEDQLKNLTAFGGTLTDAEREQHNQQVADPRTMVDAIRALMFRHQQALGSGDAQPLISSDGSAAPSAGAYTSKREMLLERQDPRMNRDAAYTAAVQARTHATTPAGINALR